MHTTTQLLPKCLSSSSPSLELLRTTCSDLLLFDLLYCLKMMLGISHSTKNLNQLPLLVYYTENQSLHPLPNLPIVQQPPHRLHRNWLIMQVSCPIPVSLRWGSFSKSLKIKEGLHIKQHLPMLNMHAQSYSFFDFFSFYDSYMNGYINEPCFLYSHLLVLLNYLLSGY